MRSAKNLGHRACKWVQSGLSVGPYQKSGKARYIRNQYKKLISLDLGDKDDKYVSCKTANMKILGGEILLSAL